MLHIVVLLIVVSGTCGIVGCAETSRAEPILRVSSEQQRFDALVARYGDLTYQQLADQAPKREYLKQLSFDPADAKFYEEVTERLQLTDAEREILRKNGFVSVDHDQRYSFGSLYYAVYTKDLPVLITTDSILHAMHSSYDDVLMQLEQTFFTAALEEVLSLAHEDLSRLPPQSGVIEKSCKDVDLYLTVARNLLMGAGAPAAEKARRGMDAWDGTLLVRSQLGQDQEATAILKNVQSLKLQNALQGEFTNIYGGRRAIDYSQFKPRGHYLKSVSLSRYFRAMMWLGRADTGWNVLPADRQSGIVSDSTRELRDAALLTAVLQSSGAIEPLRQMSEIINFLVGESDNLTVFQTVNLLKQQKIDGIGDLASGKQIDALQDALHESELGMQRVRSQVVLSDPNDLYQVPPPSTFQMFGQRFVVDSFVLSKVVYDSVIFRGEKIRRHMPSGVDVMVALGNDTALPLLEEGMVELPYAANLKASQEFVGKFQQPFWRENLYSIWLDTLRTLDVDPTSEKHFPEAMRTEAWQRKQLQTQLASWAELRHDNVLYAKQSYTVGESCEYPTGYVEPYPETYTRIKLFADEAARRIGSANFKLPKRDYRDIQQRQVAFFQQMAGLLEKLENLSRKELAAEPFTDEDQAWLKKAIDKRGGGSGGPSYSGWYSQLYYGGGWRCADWDPTVIDVHTDPNSQSVLELGVGNCNFLIVAVDNELDRMIYVGPSYSYYEFRQPVSDRLTDQQWKQMLPTEKVPARPAWSGDFQAPKLKRSLGSE